MSELVFSLSEKLRPVLLKIFPQQFLKFIKNKIVYRKAAKLKKEGILPFDPKMYPKGVNLIGGIRTQNGLGQSCRLVADILEQTGWEYTIYDYSAIKNIGRNDHSHDDKVTNMLPYSINLLHLNPFELQMAHLELGNKLFNGHYNIGYWLYEIEKIPEDWLPGIDLVDEIWTPSEYISNCFRKLTDKPVYTRSYSVSAPIDPEYDRKYFQLPEDVFLYLVMYDANSTSSRKNPLGAINAFKSAFSHDDDKVGLVVKINHGSREDIAFLQQELKDYHNIFFITHTMDKTEVNSLIADADVFVSLHRAEGFGLVMAEAMLNGTACIATDYSSNTEFMDAETACMVDYKLIELTGDTGFYPKGSKWAEPDYDQAAEYMRRLLKEPEFYSEITKRAKVSIEKKMQMKAVQKTYAQRLEEIYAINRC